MRLFISTGEVSGDLQGSFLVKALLKESERRSIPLKILGLGGTRMENEGAELIANTSSIGAIGFLEVLPYLLPTLKTQKIVDKLFDDDPPDALILIDYMGPNVRLGNKVRKLNSKIPIIYYIAPQEWAWSLGEGGSTDLISFSSKILAIFQKEADFYSSRGGRVSWVGHPMLDNLKDLPSRNEACLKLGLDPGQKFLLILPASRSQELKYLLPTLLSSAALLQKKDPNLFILLPAGQKKFEAYLQNALEQFDVRGKVFNEKDADELKPYIFKVSDLALAKSGTINMELALHLVPQIVGYKVSRITAFIATKLLRFKVDHISPVNILLNKRLIPELVQNEFNSSAIFDLASSILEDNVLRKKILNGYEELRKGLGEPGVTVRAAKEIFDLVT